MRKLCVVHTNLHPSVRWQFCSEEAPGCTGRLFGRYKYILATAAVDGRSKLGRFLTVSTHAICSIFTVQHNE